MSNPDPILAFNGVNGATGDYGFALSATQLARLVLSPASSEERQEQERRYREAILGAQKQRVRGVKEGIDPTDLRQAGWGVIFAYADPQTEAIRQALQPLLTLRQSQAEHNFQLFTGLKAYRANESKTEFLKRHGVASGVVDPSKGVPYYLLLIGNPELIPFEFQYQLDVQFAVGRLDFDDLADYEHYARTVVAAELGQITLERRASFFGVRNPDDKATALTHQYLVEPLLQKLKPQLPDWHFAAHLAESATRRQLEQTLGGEQRPALLFTASHGLEFPLGDVRQRSLQGSLLCQDWPGPEAWHGRGAIPEAYYLAGDHLANATTPGGMVTFHFACYGGGTPQHYDFSRQEGREQYQIAKQPFVANLPKKLLAHPKGGALAVISHIDRAWSYSFKSGPATSQTTVFESALLGLMKGQPVGMALEPFNNRYAELAADLNQQIGYIYAKRQVNELELLQQWAENNDARNYIVLGDPAVRLAVPGLGKHPDEIETYADGRPNAVSSLDWQQTPVSVKTVLSTALGQLKQLKTQVAKTEQSQRPVYRDGGRALDSPSTEPATVRSTTTRNGGHTRSGTTRSGPNTSGTRGNG